MISLEAWRGRIGVWAGRVRLSSKVSAPKMNISVRQPLDILWGISTLLVAAVICLLSIVGGVEVNPGPLRRDNSNSEDDLEIPLVSILQNIWKVNISFLHPKPPLPKVTDVNLNIVQRDVLINYLDAESR